MNNNTAWVVIGMVAILAILLISVVYQVQETKREYLRTNNCECEIKK